MTEFSREALEAAFVKGGISPRDDDNHDDISALRNQLHWLAREWRIEKAELQDLNTQLAGLEATQKFIDEKLCRIEASISNFDPEAISRLSRAVGLAIDFIKNKKSQHKLRGDDAETILFNNLRNIYINLGGAPGITEGGPFHRFAQACAALMDASIDMPQAQTLRKAIHRWEESSRSRAVVKQPG